MSVLTPENSRAWFKEFDRRTGGNFQRNGYLWSQRVTAAHELIKRDLNLYNDQRKQMDAEVDSIITINADQKREAKYRTPRLQDNETKYVNNLWYKFGILSAVILILGLCLSLFGGDITQKWPALAIMSVIGVLGYGVFTWISVRNFKKSVDELVIYMRDEDLVSPEEIAQIRSNVEAKNVNLLNDLAKIGQGAHQIQQMMPLHVHSSPYILIYENQAKVLQRIQIESYPELETDDLPDFVHGLRATPGNTLDQLFTVAMSRDLHGKIEELVLFLNTLDDALVRAEATPAR